MNMSGNSKRIERFLDVTLWGIIVGGIVLPLLGVGIAGQEWFGPGIGTPCALTPLLVLIGFLVWWLYQRRVVKRPFELPGPLFHRHPIHCSTRNTQGTLHVCFTDPQRCI